MNNNPNEEIIVIDEIEDYDTTPAPQIVHKSDAEAPSMKELRRRKRMKLSWQDIVFYTLNTLLLTIFTVVTLYPILNTLVISFNDGFDALRGGIYLWPRKFTTKNYDTVFNMQTMPTGAKISVLRTVIGTALQLYTTALLAYVLSIKDFVFRKGVSFFYVITMYLGAGLIPTFLWYKELGMTNSFWVYVIPGMISGFNLMVLRTAMQDIPESLRESAQLDGANHLNIFFRIYLPLCKPVMATVALFVAVYQWSAWFDTMIYNRTATHLTTLQYELMKLLSSVSAQSSGGSAYTSNTHQAAQITSKSVRSAATIITSFPVVCLYPFLQRYFITGMTIGGVKE